METQLKAKYLTLGIVLFLAGTVAGVYADPYLPASVSNAKKSYQSGFVAARTLVENSNLGNFFKTPDDVRSISGTVTAVSSAGLTLHTSSESPFDDLSLTERTVTVDTSTAVVRLTQKDPKVFQSELDAFMKTAQVGSSTAMGYPSPFVQMPAGFENIKVGDTVIVTAADNIRTKSGFAASSIQIVPQVATP
ncbi:MAG TPA: hypothetical protein VMV62_00405 [Candidatus Paceibacterota bacterium]|nr:hypothetical protein [Candidatus Paceibacterota bacterium]